MEHSHLLPLSRGLVSPSPTTPHLASASGNCLDIHDLHTLTLLSSTTTAGPITSLSWAHHDVHGPLISAASTPPNTAVVVSATTGAVLADVHETPLAPASLALSPSARHLLLSAEHALAHTVVCVDPPHQHVSLPFPKGSSLHAWSPRAARLAAVTRRNGVDGLVVLHLPSLRVRTALRGPAALGGVTHVAGVHWTSAGLLIWGTATDPAGHAAIALLSGDGHVLMAGDPADGSAMRLPCVDQVPPVQEPVFGQMGLGIASVSVSKAGSLAAVAGHDGLLRVVNLHTWMQAAAFAHDSPVVDDDVPPVVFRERTKLVFDDADGAEQEGDGDDEENVPKKANGGREGRKSLHRSYFDVVDCLATDTIEVSTRSPRTKRKSAAVSFEAFSPCGEYLASRRGKAPNVVFVWNIAQVRLAAVLVLQEDARCIRWSNSRSEDIGSQLAVVSGGDHLYLWRPSGAAAIRIGATQQWRSPFRASKVTWGCDDSAVVVADGVSAKAFMVMYIS